MRLVERKTYRDNFTGMILTTREDAEKSRIAVAKVYPGSGPVIENIGTEEEPLYKITVLRWADSHEVVDKDMSQMTHTMEDT